MKHPGLEHKTYHVWPLSTNTIQSASEVPNKGACTIRKGYNFGPVVPPNPAPEVQNKVHFSWELKTLLVLIHYHPPVTFVANTKSC